MAYMNKERKSKLAPGIKAALQKYKVRGTIAVSNHMTLVVNISAGAIDFFDNFNRVAKDRNWREPFGIREAKDCMDVNPYWYHEHFDGRARDCLKELITAMNVGNHDNSDSQTDYFDVGWYIDVNIGRWNKPYTLTA